jgi:hypothetical protein
MDKNIAKSIKLDDNLSDKTGREEEREKEKEKERKIKTPRNKGDKIILSNEKNKSRNRTPTREKNRFKYFLNDDNIYDTKTNYEEEKSSEKKYERKNKRAKTVLYESVNIPFLIGLENFPLEKYISVSFTNRFLNKAKSPTKKNKKNNLIQIIVEEDGTSNKSNKMSLNNYRTKTEFSLKNKNKNNNINLNSEYFSLDEFLIPYNTKKGEELFLTKSGNILINKKQKDILEDYINNYLCEDDDENKSKTEKTRTYNIITNKGIKEKLKAIKTMKNKKFHLKGTNTNYDLNYVNELFKILPPSFQIPIDDFYLKKKKASLFDRSIFKICHKVIDNYKELENKEEIFSFKSKSRNKSKSKPKNISTNTYGYRKLYSH